MKKASLIALSLLIAFNVNAAGWYQGKLTKVESYTAKSFLQWTGGNPQTNKCAKEALVMSAGSLGSDAAFERAYSTALTALVSNKSILVYLDGCTDSRQKITAFQICANDDCAY